MPAILLASVWRIRAGMTRATHLSDRGLQTFALVAVFATFAALSAS
jgi:hypothetical protein